MKPYMEIPLQGRESNPDAEPVIMLGPGNGIGDLPVLKGRDDTGMSYICSYWYLNDDELSVIQYRLEHGEPLVFELTVLGEGQPPVAINVLGTF